MTFEFLGVVLIAVFALVIAGLLSRRSRQAGATIAAVCLVGIGIGGAFWRPTGDPELAAALPTPRSETTYATSDACQTCHPSAYHAWEKSYHRTMTQSVGPENVLANFEDVRLSSRGHDVHLSRRGDHYWANMPDPLWFQDPSPDKPLTPPRIDARVVMTTGSHHLQNYWVRRPTSGSVYRDSFDNGALVQIPFVWIIDANRWVPGQDSFLTPPSDEPESPLVWNSSCHLCHSVSTSPGFDEGQFDTASVELGIACEACHGPGESHIARNQNPLRRYLSYWNQEYESDIQIVNAARLDQDRSIEVCGQCHSFSRILDMAKWKKSGVDYRPGQPLAEVKAILRYADDPSDPHLLAAMAEEPNALVGRFWADGTIRVTGREMNAVIESACFQRGDLTCISCHSMHDYEDVDNQLARGGQSNESCISCHPGLAKDLASHTRHAPTSSGSLCMNCHMPHTTYGLFKAIRSHRIDNPSVAVSIETGRPNACNLCHLDKTLAWADRELQKGWGLGAARLPENASGVAASVEWTLSGDAAQRAIVAWHMGWEPALEASGGDWVALYLGQLLSDPYAAVRRVAQVSIEQRSGFEGFEYDYLADPTRLVEKSQEAWSRWAEAARPETFQGRNALLLRENRELNQAEFARLLRARNHTPLRIIE